MAALRLPASATLDAAFKVAAATPTEAKPPSSVRKDEEFAPTHVETALPSTCLSFLFPSSLTSLHALHWYGFSFTGESELRKLAFQDLAL